MLRHDCNEEHFCLRTSSEGHFCLRTPSEVELFLVALLFEGKFLERYILKGKIANEGHSRLQYETLSLFLKGSLAQRPAPSSCVKAQFQIRPSSITTPQAATSTLLVPSIHTSLLTYLQILLVNPRSVATPT